MRSIAREQTLILLGPSAVQVGTTGHSATTRLASPDAQISLGPGRAQLQSKKVMRLRLLPLRLQRGATLGREKSEVGAGEACAGDSSGHPTCKFTGPVYGQCGRTSRKAFLCRDL